MALKLRSVVAPGNLKNERITLRSKGQSDAGDYLLAQTPFEDDEISVTVLNSYWFPYEDIEDGDLVVLYTKSGSPRQKELSTGKVAHFFYWGLKQPIWDTPDTIAVLMHAPVWEAKVPGDLLKK